MSATDGSEDMLKKVAAMTHATETPITDRNVTGPDDKWVDAEIARDLERRLAAAEAELQVAQRKLEKYRLRTDESALQSAWGEAREACARVCDEYPLRDPAEDGNGYWAAEECAKAIRSLPAPSKAAPEPTAKDLEQAAFEKWLSDKCPSGDVESVQRQWLQSYEYAEFLDEQEPVNAAQSPGWKTGHFPWCSLHPSECTCAGAAPLAEQRGDELDELRAEQARLVMPHIGPLLDAWEVLPNDVSQDDDLSGVRHHIEQIFQCMDSNGNPSTPAVQLRADVDDEAIRAIWRANGGDFHGPHIETGKMPESKLLPFLRRLIAEIPSAAPASPAAAKEE